MSTRSTSSPGEEVDALPAGTQLLEFEIVRVLGVGGFGVVYLALDQLLQRQVAIKEYLPAAFAYRQADCTVVPRSGERHEAFEHGRRCFLDEARLLARFDHPALVKVLRYWEAHGTAYMAMPFYEGRTLRERLRDEPGFATEARLRALCAPLLDALERLHAERVFHRDVSPDNIIVQADGAPVLLDFGAARRVLADMTHAPTVVLKPGFAPIEQYADDGGLPQGPWTDIYGLAAVLYTAVAGHPPIAAVGRAYTDPLRPLQADPPPGFSAGFLAAIDAGLAVRPEQRPQSIAEFRDLLGITPAAATATGTPARDDVTVVLPPTAGLAPRRTAPAAATAPGASARASRSDATVDSARGVRTPRARETAAAIVSAIAITVVAGWLILNRNTATQGGSAPPDAGRNPRAEAQARALAELRSLDCASLRAVPSSAGLVVSGQVTGPEQRGELERRLASIGGLGALQYSLVEVPPPFCTTVGALADIATAPTGSLEVRIVQPPLPWRVGQRPVVLEVVAPDFAGHVAVDVWSAADAPSSLEVAHLLPHDGLSVSDRVRPGQTLPIALFRDDALRQEIEVQPPAGPLLITAIASDRPLVRPDRSPEQAGAAYAAELRAASATEPRPSRIATWYRLVDVRP